MKFLHTADWQIGKPFAGIRDERKRSLVQHARIEAIKRLGDVAKNASADFIVVAGDLFDSPSADKSTVSVLTELGGKSGNQSLRDQLGWDETKYAAVKDQLVADGQIVPGKGRGGSVVFPDGAAQ